MNYYAPYHGHSTCDGHFGKMKRTLRQKLASTPGVSVHAPQVLGQQLASAKQMVEMLKVLSSTTITIIPEKDIEAVAEREICGAEGLRAYFKFCFPEFGLVKGSMLSNIQYTWEKKISIK